MTLELPAQARLEAEAMRRGITPGPSTLRIGSPLEARYRRHLTGRRLSSLPKWWLRLATARSAPFGVSVLRSPDS